MSYYGGMPWLAIPQELGGAYVYLLSDTASYTTGIDIPIAGIVGAWLGASVIEHYVGIYRRHLDGYIRTHDISSNLIFVA